MSVCRLPSQIQVHETAVVEVIALKGFPGAETTLGSDLLNGSLESGIYHIYIYIYIYGYISDNGNMDIIG